MILTNQELTTLDKAEQFLSHYASLSSGSLMAEINKEGFIHHLEKITKVVHSFSDSGEAPRFIKVANGLIEGAYRAGHPNSLKEHSASLALNHVFPEIKISGKDPVLERRYEDQSCSPLSPDLK